ncbi:MAG: thioesterase family protein [bacterium]|nr:thioesterase family protein [bacterium]
MTQSAYRHRLSVRYFETDQMAVVYYSHYLVWFEAARTDYLKSKGFPYARLEEMGFYLPVTEAYCKYLTPARYEDEIIVETRIDEMKNASLKISYRVLREKDEKLLATGFTVHPCINRERRIVRFPEVFLQALS